MKTNERVAAVGVGYSTTGRRTGLSSWQLGLQAARAALDDAGMTPGDIDGIAILCSVAGPTPAGVEIVNSLDLAYSLGISPLNWFSDQTLAPAYVAAAINGIAAIRAGMAHTVLTLRIINQRMSAADEIKQMREAGPALVGGDAQFTAPFGSLAPVFAISSLQAQRHMDRFGTTEEQFGGHVIAQRRHAALNDNAIFRDPLTMDDYLASRYIAKPTRLLDCDYPVDSASAIIYTAGDRAHDRRHQPVWVESMAYSSTKYLSFEMVDDMNHASPFHAADQLYARTSITPDDIDCAQLYDGFTIIVFQWLEALRFCGLGEAGRFIEDGNTALGGRLPVNTDGGACNVGRRHGANFCIESIRQLRGDCGDRQVPDAEVAVWTNSTGPFTGAVLMTKE